MAASPGRRRSLALILTLAAVTCAAAVLGLALGPLFAWQTAIVTLVIDQYRVGVLAPVPFAAADTAGFEASMAHAPGIALGGQPLAIDGMQTFEGMRDLLLPKMASLPVRAKDALVAYVRGQTVAAVPVFDVEGMALNDPINERPCIVASNCTVRGARPRELIPIRDVVEAIGAATSRTTLVLLDLGDIEWDPRLGTMAHVVPRLLDDELKPAQKQSRGDVWVLGSQDLFQTSGASLSSGRTFFGRATELALSGAADAPGCGDGDGVVELDEVMRFVTAWTHEWVRRASGGRRQQTPVLWKLGAGRVAVDGVPAGVGLVRVGRTHAATKKPLPAETPPPGEGQKPPAASPLAPAPVAPTPVAPAPAAATPAAARAPRPRTIVLTAGEERSEPRADTTVAGAGPQVTGELAFPGKADPATAADRPQPEPVDSAAAESAAVAPDKEKSSTAAKPALPQPDAQPTTPQREPPPAPPPVVDPWQGLARLAARGALARRGTGASATVADVSPHVWAALFSFTAAATAAADLDDAANPPAVRTLQDIAKALAAVPPPPGGERRGDPANVALSAWLTAEEAGVLRAWAEAPAAMTAALATFTDGVIAVRSAVDVLGSCTGGANESPMDLDVLATLVEKLSALRRAIAESHSGATADESPADARGLPSLTRTAGTQAGLVVDQIDHVLDALLTRGGGAAADPPFPVCLAALRNPAVLATQRDAVLRALRAGRPTVGAAPAAPTGPVTLATGSGPLPRQIEYGRVEQAHLARVAALTDVLAALIDAVVAPRAAASEVAGASTRIAGGLADVRREIVTLVEPFGSERVAVSRIVRLGGRVAELFAMLAAAAEEPHTGAVGFDELAAGALRSIDPRDEAALTGVSVIGLPSRLGPGVVDVTVAAIPSAPLAPGESAVVRVLIGRTQRPVDDPLVRIVFEPADLDVQLEGGERIDPQRPLPLSRLLGAAGDMPLRVTVQRHAVGRDQGVDVPLTVRCESQGRVSVAETRIRVVGDRTIALAVRQATPERIETRSSWRFARPVRTTPAGDETTVVLPGFAGRTVAWEVGLENRSGAPRTVAAELYSLGPPTASAPDPWLAFMQSVATSKPLPASLAAAAGVALGADRTPVRLVLAPSPAEALPPPAPPAGVAAAPPPEPLPRPVGPDLALVVRETTKGASEKRWLHRLTLAAEHPRDLFDASATWSARDRTITVRIAARESRSGALDEPVIVTLGTLGGTAVASERFVQVRRGSIALSRAAPADTLVAEWTGPEREAQAWITVTVNGYPRAFVFAVECTPATDGQPQPPQSDWRRVRIASPAERLTLLRAPVDTFPLTLSIDAPPDARFSGRDAATPPGEAAAGLVRLVLREARAGSMAGDPGRVVWTAITDRRIDFALVKPPPPATLAISTVVADWRIDVPGTGFVDVDVEAEAGLAMPGVQRPLTATTRFVFDGRPPVVEAPASVNAVVGRRLVIPVRVTDDPRESFTSDHGVRLPGVSGVERVEWAIDAKGDGKPEGWKPASNQEGGRYEITIDTAAFVPGVRLPALVRATDRVGLSAAPTRVWIDVGRKAAKAVIRGTVKVEGRGEAGVTISVDGPGSPRPVRSGPDGGFTIADLDPGEYKLSAAGAVRNRSRTAAPVTVAVPAPPADPPTVTLELK